MLIDRDSKYLLKKTRSKAKMYEYSIPENLHIAVESNANELLLIAVAAIGNISTYILSEKNPFRFVPKEMKGELEFASRFFDAFLNSKLEPHYNQYYLLLGSISYYLCDYIGSSKVMANMINIEALDLGCNEIEKVLVGLLLDNVASIDIENIHNPYGSYLKEVIAIYAHYFDTGDSFDPKILYDFRKLIYSQGTPRELLLADATIAILLRKIVRSSFNLLPAFSGLAKENWKDIINSQQNIRELWPAQIRLGESGIYMGKSAVIQMPTSSGKTTSITIAIRAAFISARTSLAVIVTPYRALCREISYDIASCFTDDTNIRVNELNDILEFDESLNLEELFSSQAKNVLILTPEKLIYLLRQDKELFRNIGLVIFDEAHIFDDASRGAKYELLLATILGLLGNDTQKIMISAVIPNVTQLNEWFTHGEGVAVADNSIKASERSIAISDWNREHGNYGYLYFIDSEDNSQEEFYVPRVVDIRPLKKLHPNEKSRSFPEVDFQVSKVEHNDMAIYYAIKLNHNGGIAIFCGKKDTVDSVLKRALDIERRGIDISSFLSNSNLAENLKIAHLIKENYGEDSIYHNAALKGMFAHHGGISNGIRISIEYALKEDLIRCIVCTSTLAQGVNLPIKYLIISNLYQAQEQIKVRDFHNLIGRAGRAGLFTEGTIILSEPFVYLRRHSFSERWRWERYQAMLDVSNSESCISELLMLVRSVDVPLGNHRILSVDFFEFIKANYKGTKALKTSFKAEADNLDQVYPGNAFREIARHILNCLEAIESYLLSFLSDTEQDMNSVLSNTFGFFQANESEKERLASLFNQIKTYLLEQTETEQKRAIYSRTLLGIDQLIELEEWVVINTTLLLECGTTSEVLQIVVPKLLEYADRKSLQSIIHADDAFIIGDMWIRGLTYKQIFDYTTKTGIQIIRRKRVSDISLKEVVEICDNGFGYSSTLIINAIAELLFMKCKDDQGTCKLLYDLAEQMRYGLPTKKSILIYEAGFSDRVIAQKMANALSDLRVKNKKQLRRAIHAKSDIIPTIISEYPTIYYDRLTKLDSGL